MFDSITQRFTGIWGQLTRKKISEKNVRDTLREIRVALLEADVALPVVKDFLARVEEATLGEDVLKGVNPGQQFIETVYREMAALMGPEAATIELVKPGPTIILMAGLQGSGKTTTCAKLALNFKKKGLKPLLVAADVQRPAAIEQLKVLGGQIGVEVFSEDGAKPPQICQHAVRHAGDRKLDVVILDTAGRLHIDDEMMREVKEVAHLSNPHEILLVCDSMVGQDAVRSASEFDNQLELTGVILTKLDGDARGGAALSVKAITGKPIKFVGIGEKIDGGLEPFRPDGMAQRILGYGDVIGLVEKAREVISEEEAEKLQEHLLKNTFTLNHFLDQIRRVRQMGSMKDLMKMIPGFGGMDMDGVDDNELVGVEAIIQSMTPKERLRPEILNTVRRDRIARGCGKSRQEVDDLVRQFNMMKKVMDQASQVGGRGPLGKVKSLMNAKKQFGDISGMLSKFAEADPEAARARGRAKKLASRGPSREELRRRKKDERKRRRRARKR